MRKTLVALSALTLAVGAFSAIDTQSASAAGKMTAKGCMVGKQTWNAVEGKCMDKMPVAKKKSMKKMMKKDM